MIEIVINTCFGGFRFPEEVKSLLHIDDWDDSYTLRTHPDFVQFVKEHANENGEYHNPQHSSELSIALISDDVTDWRIDEYDGCESILYVEDGKICDEYDTWNPVDYPLPGPTEVKTRKYTVVIHAVYDLEADNSEEAIEQAMAELVNEDTDAFTVVERAD